MAEDHDLNKTDASNTARWPENMAPSAVNNAGRGLEGLLARYIEDVSCKNAATLSAGVISVTLSRSSITLTGTTSNYVSGLVVGFQMGANPNTGPVTLNLNGIGAISLRDNRGVSLSTSVLLSGTFVLAIKDGTNNYFRMVWPHSAA